MDPGVRYRERHPDFTFDTIAHLPMANIAGIDLYCMNPVYMGGKNRRVERSLPMSKTYADPSTHVFFRIYLLDEELRLRFLR